MEPLQNPRHDLTPRLTHGAGRQGHTSPSGRGRKMSLTSPLIDQAITRFDQGGDDATEPQTHLFPLKVQSGLPVLWRLSRGHANVQEGY
jgi:hypothetical protein